MKINAEIEPVYILGDFSVRPAEKGWEIEAPVAAYTTGSWKTQGMPFYSWGVTYSEEFNVENTDGKWEIALAGSGRNSSGSNSKWSESTCNCISSVSQ